MKFAGRMNSFMFKGNYDLFQTIEEYKKIDGITHLEFNYPEHVAPYSVDELKARMGHLKVNGVATRFRDSYTAGEFTNPDPEKSRAAVQLCRDAVDACKALGGSVLTVWLGFDGFDYAFQVDYEKNWNTIIASFREVAAYGEERGIRISIEYKPFEPRAFSMIDGIGLTLLAIDEIGSKNVGVTLDFCHMMMKNESPAFSLALAARRNRLFGLHLNDGYRIMDSGMIFGSVNYIQCVEFIYYLKKYNYEGVVFFDSFPVRETAAEEIAMNIKMVNLMSKTIDEIGMDRIQRICEKQDGVSSQDLAYAMLSHKLKDS
ncbi:sugar phosphate isomerase/epimerase family protein [Breznakiella homolactica]|uniref:Sugar phosphate isomerase/epimerase n=1 Tax=Breznakiella homolactica TaxID=2798577 RepID=A0A7T7XQD8_9SPIR|nr:sugar phosphate isomerase/epimerase family protein [Breznakiella homolactica]QQO10585.1 sugar phosphate isomerase/epimerase [Breznakiella homolactica]